MANIEALVILFFAGVKFGERGPFSSGGVRGRSELGIQAGRPDSVPGLCF